MDSLEVQVELIRLPSEQYSKLEALQHRIEKSSGRTGIDRGVTSPQDHNPF